MSASERATWALFDQINGSTEQQLRRPNESTSHSVNHHSDQTEDIINLEYDPDNSLLIIQAIAAAVTTEDIINLEYDPDNSLLIIQAIAAAVTVILMMMLGIWATCRRQRYSDELQKA
ncbi:unnamed protein product [Heligmosomoides polygyrus]|uniref:Cadherin_C domain-containing protein n=1 Tax=Heligmosomoides polygyrus TaxID=6339 RepID=A0A3P7XCW7_HELPZ|nr:unnamed protein product [Heligmosomoides polygyrus]